MNEPGDLPRLLTAKELSELTGLSREQVYRMVREHDMPHVRLGRALRFDPAAVRDWINAGGTASGSAGEESRP